MTGDVLDAIRAECARVADCARFVRIDPVGQAALADELAGRDVARPALDPAHHYVGEPDATLAYVLVLDALNFGSGWFPVLRKRDGFSGYFTVASSLKEQFEECGPWSAEGLVRLRAADLAKILGQDPEQPEALELMELFARALADLGRFLLERFDGRFAGPVEQAEGSAARLVELLAEMPLYRDVARYAGREVPFFKRAQLTAADLAAAFDGRGPGAFEDLDRLTIFADNLVPHVLRLAGVLVYDPDLLARIEAGALIPAGSPEEVEIRATALHAVEGCVERIRSRGGRSNAGELDFLLWNRGQRPEVKAHPRHRTRTSYY